MRGEEPSEVKKPSRVSKETYIEAQRRSAQHDLEEVLASTRHCFALPNECMVNEMS